MAGAEGACAAGHLTSRSTWENHEDEEELGPEWNEYWEGLAFRKLAAQKRLVAGAPMLRFKAELPRERPVGPGQ
jgi:hypothetical protein